jgi:selenocysteine lyase/cysteine desulfurase
MSDVSRRAFIAGAGVVAAGGLAACRRSGSADDASAGGAGAEPLDPSSWESVRDQFALTPDVLHFAAFVLAAHPRPVADAIARHRDGLDADTHGYLAEHQAELESSVLGAAAAYLGAAPEEVGLTDSTTMGLGLLYGGLALDPGHTVLTTEHDFYSTHESLRLRAERTGASVERVRLYDDPASATVDEIVGRLAGGVSGSTRAVAVTWVHSGTGVKLPIADIAAALDDGVLLCVDGVHGLGVEDAGVRDLGADFLVAGTHKWLFGPRGTGIVWGRSEAWEAVQPTIPTFAAGAFERALFGEAVTPVTPGHGFTPGGYHSFEHRWALAEAFDFHAAIGRDRIADRTHEQATRLKEGLAEIGGVRVVTPMAPELSAGIVCVELAGRNPFEAMEALGGQRISASVTPYREPYLRFGPSIVTTPDEVDEVIEAVAGLA